ncbi:Protein phosphatase 2C 29 [Zea mays]|uniref:protein-serine/threonine phosphatase n=1 Tax=Zea mays TaxID=4577 RepID=A0A1D6H6Z9_MAIZE|nr:Protein phosphatase 2C 29 [Zea mays]
MTASTAPEAPDFLVANLYRFLLRELRGIFYKEADPESKQLWQFLADGEDEDSELDFSGSGRFALSLARLKEQRHPLWAHAAAVGDGQSGREWGVKRLTVAPAVRDHRAVLSALARALATTESTYLDKTSQSMGSRLELAVTGACLVVVLLRDDDVYVMNLGDSRAIVAQRWDDEDCLIGSMQVEDIGVSLETETRIPGYSAIGLEALQLSTDHSTSIEEEVQRIRHEHPDDDQCVVNDRVKGRLTVTRAFGAGYLKQVKKL